MRPDQTLGGVERRQPQLLAEHVPQRPWLRCQLCDPVQVVGRVAASPSADAVEGRTIELSGVIHVERPDIRGGKRVRIHDPVHRRFHRSVLGSRVWPLIQRGPFRRHLAALVALQQRIALEFLIDEGGNFHVRELQELDGLPQLRRHHQTLRMSQLQPRPDPHSGNATMKIFLQGRRGARPRARRPPVARLPSVPGHRA